MVRLSTPQDPEAARAQTLSQFLRARRERLHPAQVGLPAGSRRRTPGLRREEVAMLAGISETYYVFLEQGRGARPSAAVVSALAAALLLDPVEQAVLRDLARGSRGSPVAGAPAPAEVADPDAARLVERLDPDPAYITGRCWDVLASNRAARLLWTDWNALAPPQRNMVWWMFADPQARAALPDWHEEAMALLGRLRAAAAHHPGDPDFAELIERVSAASPEFREGWSRFEVAPLAPGIKRLRHAELGVLMLRFSVLQVANHPEQKLVAFQLNDDDRARVSACMERVGRIRGDGRSDKVVRRAPPRR